LLWCEGTERRDVCSGSFTWQADVWHHVVHPMFYCV